MDFIIQELKEYENSSHKLCAFWFFYHCATHTPTGLIVLLSFWSYLGRYSFYTFCLIHSLKKVFQQTEIQLIF